MDLVMIGDWDNPGNVFSHVVQSWGQYMSIPGPHFEYTRMLDSAIRYIRGMAQLTMIRPSSLAGLKEGSASHQEALAILRRPIESWSPTVTTQEAAASRRRIWKGPSWRRSGLERWGSFTWEYAQGCMRRLWNIQRAS
jgi:hypothetical protein